MKDRRITEAKASTGAHEFPYGIADVVARDMLTVKDAEIQRLNKLVTDLTANQCQCPEIGYSMDTR